MKTAVEKRVEGGGVPMRSSVSLHAPTSSCEFLPLLYRTPVVGLLRPSARGPLQKCHRVGVGSRKVFPLARLLLVACGVWL